MTTEAVPAGAVSDGAGLVLFVPTIANINAPTATELNAGTVKKLTYSIVAGGYTHTITVNKVKVNRLTLAQELQYDGVVTDDLSIKYAYTNTAGDVVRLALPRGCDRVHRRTVGCRERSGHRRRRHRRRDSDQGVHPREGCPRSERGTHAHSGAERDRDRRPRRRSRLVRSLPGVNHAHGAPGRTLLFVGYPWEHTLSFEDDIKAAFEAPKPTHDVDVTLNGTLYTFRVTRMDGVEWASLADLFPARPGVMLDTRYGYNLRPLTLAAAAKSAQRLDGDTYVDLTDDQWRNLFKALPGASIQRFSDALFLLNEYGPAQEVEDAKKASVGAFGQSLN
jgi:hypothetical protein